MEYEFSLLKNSIFINCVNLKIRLNKKYLKNQNFGRFLTIDYYIYLL
jgi:hypothetical protein